jgi:hypothetical protein
MEWGRGVSVSKQGNGALGGAPYGVGRWGLAVQHQWHAGAGVVALWKEKEMSLNGIER